MPSTSSNFVRSTVNVFIVAVLVGWGAECSHADTNVHKVLAEKARECAITAIAIIRNPEEYQTSQAREEALARAVGIVVSYEKLQQSLDPQNDKEYITAIAARIVECKGAITKALSGGN